MFHFFAQTEPKKQKKSVVITSGGGQKQKATTEKSPLRRLVQHGHRLTWFTYIFNCLRPTERENLQLRRSCKLFSKALKPLPCWTSFPHPEYSTLKKLFARFDALSISGSTNIPKLVLIENGIHDEGGNIVDINMSISIVGESREHCVVLGGLEMNGNEEDDVNVSNLTLRDSKWNGVRGGLGASTHLDNVSVENSGRRGVSVRGSKRNTMKNCNVSHSKGCGLEVVNGGLMTIDGNATTVHRNGTRGGRDDYGLFACVFSSSFIHLVSPLTIETVSTDNGGGNVDGGGTIAIVDNEGTIVETIQEATEDIYNYN